MREYAYSERLNGLHMDIGFQDQNDSLDMYQYVNPQETDKQYRCTQLDQSVTLTNGRMTPPQSTTDPSSRRPSLMISSTPISCNAGLDSTSSASSFESSPGCPSSCPSSASSAPSSRRQSTIYSDFQQPCSYLSVASPTPIFRGALHKQTWNYDQQPLPCSYLTNEQCTNANEASCMVPGGAEASNSQNDPYSIADPELTWQPNVLAYGMGACNQTQTLAMDLGLSFNGSLPISRSIDFPQSKCESPQPSIFPAALSSGPVSSHSSFQSIPPELQKGFEYQSPGYDQDMSSDNEPAPTIFTPGKRHRPNGSTRRRNLGVKIGTSVNECDFCPRRSDGKPGYSCNRPEHLKRHIEAKHPEECPDLGYQRQNYECEFTDCEDKRTGKRRTIQARRDNHKAHYTKTHFAYGAAEKNGKNKRKSMKRSIEKGLIDKDVRWTMMLAGKMKVGEDMRSASEKGPAFPNVWKMIGYSIKETRAIKVKDIVPGWQGPDDTRLEKFDCRWKALKEGTLSYDQAMSVGKGMDETPKQGLLGVDMFESKAMGLMSLDPRWKEWQSNKMTPEDQE